MGRDTAWLHRNLEAALAGRLVVLCGDVLAQLDDIENVLLDHGVPRVLLIAGSHGTGHIAAATARDAVILNTTGDGVMGGIRAFGAALDHLDNEVRARIDAFDPDHEAVAILPLFGDQQEVAGRPVFGRREPAWVALEDKTTVDALWDACGVPRAPALVVPAERAALEEAATTLDAGDGTVWVADNRTGWHGGAAYLRWVVDAESADKATVFLAGSADRVRVMPFLDGLPCSIHGWVLPGATITLRPCEMVVLRERHRPRLVYASAATSWTPTATDRDEMRAIARRTGEYLRATHGYRGVFTVDGVMTVDGFRPTELNTRFGGALNALLRATRMPGYLLHLASVARPDLDWRADDLEAVLRAATAAHVAGGWVLVDRAPGGGLTETVGLALRREPDGSLAVVDAPVDAPADAPEHGAAGTITWGPTPAGGMLRVSLAGHPAGEPAGPATAEALNVAAGALGVELADLVAAPSLR